MKAVRIHAPGGPEVLKSEDVPEPQPKAGEAVVKVDAAGLNYIDVYYRSGHYKAELPMTLGLEAGGTVTAVGPNVTEVRVGDKVAYTGVAGAYALYAAVPAQRLVVLPAGISTRQGAAAMLQGMTAHYLACSTYPLKRGDTCLVHAAPRGLMALYGQSRGPIGPFDPQVLNQKGSLFLTRPSLVHHVATREELLQRAGEVLGWIRDGKLRLRTEFEFPLKDAAEAHRALEGRKTTGKVLLIP